MGFGKLLDAGERKRGDDESGPSLQQLVIGRYAPCRWQRQLCLGCC